MNQRFLLLFLRPAQLSVIFYLLAKGYCKNRKIKADIPELEWWTGDEEEKSKEKSIIADAGAQFGV